MSNIPGRMSLAGGPSSEERHSIMAHTCSICLLDYDDTDGIECHGNGHHFLCGECFKRHVSVTCDAQDPLPFIQRKCKVFCPMPCNAAEPSDNGPDLAFTDREVMLHIGDRTWGKLHAARMQAATAAGQREAEARLAQQQQHQQNLHPQQQQAQAAGRQELVLTKSHQVTSTALTLVPPCCKRGAFLDFDACISVRCAQCPQHFCGFCVAVSGSSLEMHAHALVCPLRLPGMRASHGYFAGPGELAAARRELFKGRLQRALVPHFDGDDPMVLAELVACLDGSIRGVELEPGEVLRDVVVAVVEAEEGARRAAAAAGQVSVAYVHRKHGCRLHSLLSVTLT